MPQVLSGDGKTVTDYPDIKWSEMESDPEYQQMSVPDQTRVKIEFFDFILKPKLKEAGIDIDDQNIYNETKRDWLNEIKYEPEYPKTLKTLGYLEREPVVDLSGLKPATEEPVTETILPSERLKVRGEPIPKEPPPFSPGRWYGDYTKIPTLPATELEISRTKNIDRALYNLFPNTFSPNIERLFTGIGKGLEEELPRELTGIRREPPGGLSRPLTEDEQKAIDYEKRGKLLEEFPPSFEDKVQSIMEGSEIGIKVAPLELVKDVGGAIQFGEELVTPPIKPAGEIPKDYKGPRPHETNYGKEIFDYWNKEINEATKDMYTAPDEFKRESFMISTNIATNLPFLLAGMTGGSEMFTLLPMSLMAGAGRYGELRKEKVSKLNAQQSALLTFTSEFSTELLPTKELLKVGVPLLKRLLYTTLSDVPGEWINTLVEFNISKAFISPNLTLKDFIQQEFDTTIVSLFSAGALSSISGIVLSKQEQIEREKAIKELDNEIQGILEKRLNEVAEAEINKVAEEQRLEQEKEVREGMERKEADILGKEAKELLETSKELQKETVRLFQIREKFTDSSNEIPLIIRDFIADVNVMAELRNKTDAELVRAKLAILARIQELIDKGMDPLNTGIKKAESVKRHIDAEVDRRGITVFFNEASPLDSETINEMSDKAIENLYIFRNQESPKRQFNEEAETKIEKLIPTEPKGIIETVKKALPEELFETPTIDTREDAEAWLKTKGIEIPAKLTIDDVTEGNEIKKKLSEQKPHGIITETGTIDTITLSNIFKTELDKNQKLNKYKVIKIVKDVYGKDIDLTDFKTIDEAVEYAIIKKAREIAGSDISEDEKFNAVKILYENQPILSSRTSESIKKQQYSTPAPLSYLMNQYLGLEDKNKTVYEPTAGGGMLLITPDKTKVLANELDIGPRSIHLKDSGFTVLNEDATEIMNIHPELQKQFDVVIMNPPFKGAKPKTYGNIKIGKLDFQIALESLKAMKDSGRAVMILGGHNYDTQGQMKDTDRLFLNYLYSHYNVGHNIDINSSEVYRKMGTSFPIRLITIEGRKSVVDKEYSPSQEMVAKANSFDEIREILKIREVPEITTLPIIEEEEKDEEHRPGESSGETGERIQGEPHIRRVEEGGEDIGGHGMVGVGRDVQRPIDSRIISGRPGELGGEGEYREVSERERGGEVISTARPVDGVQADAGLLVNKFQAKHKNISDGPKEDNLLPSNLAVSITNSLKEIERLHGNIDEYVRSKLQYHDIGSLYDSFSAGQIEDLALAIHNIDKGKGIIIANATGIGKGRVGAGIIRYANILGHKPIFFTAKANLFTSIYEDLVDIKHPIKPLIINKDPMTATIVNSEGKILFKPQGSKEFFNNILNNPIDTLKDYDAIFLTYSQIQTENIQQQVIRKLADKNILILDESHEAAGESQRGVFMRDIVSKAEGVVFLSATFSKRPDTLPLYSKTALGDIDMSVEDLVQSLEFGGVPLQQILTNEIAKQMQFIRREHNYKNIKIEVLVDVKNKARDSKRVDDITNILRQIIRFDNAKMAIINKMNKEKQKEGKKLTGDKTTTAGVKSTTFGSKVHNVIGQLLFAIKSDYIIDEILNTPKTQKPLITLSNTMESFIDNYATEEGIEVGEPIDITFKEVVRRGLEKTLEYTESDHEGKKTKKKIDLEELYDLKGAYDSILNNINKLKTDVPVSPIDYIKTRLQEKGLKVGEITGRKYIIDYNQKISVLGQRTTKEVKDRNTTIRGFNDGSLDVLIYNRSGAFGISVHASEKFKDQRQRRTFILQPDLEINTFMQSMGRTFRKGQVIEPTYALIQTALPSEIRPAVILSKKMSSLNASVTANKESALSIREVPDMFNYYGNIVVTEYLEKNELLNRELGDPLKLFDNKKEDRETKSDALQSVTGKVSLLPVNTQEKFYKDIESEYIEKIEHLNQIGENNLELKSHDFKAETLEKKLIIQGTDDSSLFTANTYLEKVNVNLTKKPYNHAKVLELIETNLNGKTINNYNTDILAQIKENYDDYITYLNELKGKESDEHELKMIENRIKNQNEYYDDMTSLLKEYKIGEMRDVNISDNLRSKGVLYNITYKGKKGESIHLSDLKFRFAVPEMIQNINQTGSKILQYGYGDKYSKAEFDDWDNITPKGMKEERYIITGNLIEGLNKYNGRAEIIKFSDDKGNIRYGILLPKSYATKIDELTDTVYVNAETIYKYMISEERDIIPGNLVETTDKDSEMEISMSQIYVSSTRESGDKYYLDEDLLKMVKDNNFYSIRKTMMANFQRDKLEDILKLLESKFKLKFILNSKEYDKIKGTREGKEGEIKQTISRGIVKVPPTPRTQQPPPQTYKTPTIKLPSETWFQAFRRTWEDKNIRAKIVGEYLREEYDIDIPTEFNLYRILDMMPRTIGDMMHRLYNKKVEFIKKVVEANISLEDLGDFVFARWAPIYNEKVNKIKVDAGLPEIDNASGITDKEAKDRLNEFRQRPDYATIQTLANEVATIKREFIDFLIDARLITQTEYSNFKNDPYYVPLQREMGDDITVLGIPVQGSGDVMGKEFKRPKGSERETLNPVSNLFQAVQRAFHRLEAAKLGRAIIELVAIHPPLKQTYEIEANPVVPVGKALHTAVIDKEFIYKLIEFAKTLGLQEFETKGKAGRSIAYYSPSLKKVVRRFATSRENLAHEVGHFLDDVYKLKDKFYMTTNSTRQAGQELIDLAKEMGEPPSRIKNASERFANGFSWWLTHRNIVEENMPYFSKTMTDIINDIPELKPFLKDIRPTPKVSVEKMEEIIFGRQILFAKDEIGTIVDGVIYKIKINDPLLVRAIKSTGVVYAPGLINKTFGFSIRFMQAMVTKWKPDFIFINNPMRDIGDAIINIAVERSLLGDRGVGLRREFFKNILPSRKEIRQHLSDKKHSPKFDEFLMLGGRIGHFWGEGFKEAEKTLYDIEKMIKNEGLEKIKNMGRAVDKYVDIINEAIELGTRYAAYKVLVHRGMNKLDAVQAVADLTVNFARSGEMTKWIKPFKMFINPAIQGISKNIRTMTNKGARNRVLEILGSLIALGFLNEWLRDLIDEEGNEMISDFARDTTITISYNGKQYTPWRLMYGWSILNAMGRNLYSVAVSKKKTLNEGIEAIINAGIHSYSPIDIQTSAIEHPFDVATKIFTPDQVKILDDIAGNRSWFGGQIRPEDIYEISPSPKSGKYFQNVSKAAILTARYLYDFTGIDISPNDIEYALRQYGGGFYDVFYLLPSNIYKSITTGEIDFGDVPLIRQFYRDLPSERYVFQTIKNILDVAGKRELNELEWNRLNKAVNIGLEKGVLDKNTQNIYIQAIINGQLEVVLEMDKEQEKRNLRYKIKKEIEKIRESKL